MDGISATLSNLGAGFLSALTPEHLGFGILGVILGTATGVLPGLGPAVAIALLLPMTFGLDPVSSFIMFGGIYYGAMYGGAITSILVNTPGDSAAVVTTFDGFPMAQKGEGGKALTVAAIGSCIGGTFATVMLTLTAPILIMFALKFGPADYFALMILALTMVAAIAGESALKAAFAACVGLALAMIGIDMQSGEARWTFGIPHLYNGIDVVLGGIGLFAISEVLWVAAGGQSKGVDNYRATGVMLTASEWTRSGVAWLRGTIIGFFAGVLPGSGGTLATFLAYGVEKRFSKHPEQFGKGAIEGVAAPEAANNAAAGGSMVPLLALGIPGSATTAVMLAAFQLYGIQPGPLLFQNNADLVWTLIASLYIANILLVVLNLPLVGVWARLLRVPYGILYSAVLVFSTLGAYSLQGSLEDVGIAWALGIMAFIMRRYGFPIAPVLLALVLGPMIEQEFRRAMTISSGDLMIFFTRPISATLLFVSAVSIAAAFATSQKNRRAAKESALDTEAISVADQS
jgi:putative tricarboxylic transport membrane protein